MPSFVEGLFGICLSIAAGAGPVPRSGLIRSLSAWWGRDPSQRCRAYGVSKLVSCLQIGDSRARTEFWHPHTVGRQGKRGCSRRSREQRLRALQQANRMRLARAKLKKEFASGTLELTQILAERPSASGGQGCANCC